MSHLRRIHSITPVVTDVAGNYVSKSQESTAGDFGAPHCSLFPSSVEVLEPIAVLNQVLGRIQIRGETVSNPIAQVVHEEWLEEQFVVRF